MTLCVIHTARHRMGRALITKWNYRRPSNTTNRRLQNLRRRRRRRHRPIAVEQVK